MVTTEMNNAYDLNELKKETGMNLKDLIVNSENNDPFLIRDSKIEMAKWFGMVWDRYGRKGFHLRSLHYKLTSIKELELWNGEPYENTKYCWDKLNMASRNARYYGYVDPLELHDAKGKHEIYFTPTIPERGINAAGVRCVLPEIDTTCGYSINNPSVDIYAYNEIKGLQPYLIEIWIEKSSMNSILRPICDKYGLNLVYGEGYLSITQTVNFIERVKRSRKAGRVLYITDFDPAGDSMPEKIARQLEWFTQDTDLDIKLEQIALTKDQVEFYELPPVPLKKKDSKLSGFIEKMGVEFGSELDALEALHEGEFKKIVVEAVEKLMDKELFQKAKEVEKKNEEVLEKVWQGIRNEHDDEIKEVEELYEEIKEQFIDEMERLEEEMKPFKEKLEAKADELDKKIFESLNKEMKKVKMFIPKADKPDFDRWLFDAKRSYLEQLEYYKREK